MLRPCPYGIGPRGQPIRCLISSGLQPRAAARAAAHRCQHVKFPLHQGCGRRGCRSTPVIPGNPRRVLRRCAPPCGLRRSPLRPSPPPPSTPASRHRSTIPLTRNEIARPFPTLIIRPRPDIACGGPPGVAGTSPVPANTTASGAPRRGATIEARAMPGTAGGYSCQRPTDWRRISATSGGRCPHQSAIAARGNGRGAERWTEARLY